MGVRVCVALFALILAALVSGRLDSLACIQGRNEVDILVRDIGTI